MTVDALVKEAKRRYPKGTVIRQPSRPVLDSELYVVDRFVYGQGLNPGWYTSEHIIVFAEGVPDRGVYLYLHGQWATIISSPIPNYEIY